jgi:predicted phosphate transport protein (TIGR00153 family)
MVILFKNSKKIAAQIDEYLDDISEGMLVFSDGINNYLAGRDEDFQQHLGRIGFLESNADKTRRSVENELYVHSLIPEHRGDVLAVLETADYVIDTAKKTLFQFDVERPTIPAELHEDFRLLTQACMQCAEFLVLATRAFFKDIRAVSNNLHKVYYFEKEADRLGDNLKRRVFQLPIDLSQKIHLRYFALHIEQISDRSEEVADRLSIYTLKRSF